MREVVDRVTGSSATSVPDHLAPAMIARSLSGSWALMLFPGAYAKKLDERLSIRSSFRHTLLRSLHIPYFPGISWTCELLPAKHFARDSAFEHGSGFEEEAGRASCAKGKGASAYYWKARSTHTVTHRSAYTRTRMPSATILPLKRAWGQAATRTQKRRPGVEFRPRRPTPMKT